MIGNLISASNKEEAGAPGRHGGLGPLLLCRVGGGRGIERAMAAAANYCDQPHWATCPVAVLQALQMTSRLMVRLLLDRAVPPQAVRRFAGPQAVVCAA